MWHRPPSGGAASGVGSGAVAHARPGCARAAVPRSRPAGVPSCRAGSARQRAPRSGRAARSVETPPAPPCLPPHARWRDLPCDPRPPALGQPRCALPRPAPPPAESAPAESAPAGSAPVGSALAATTARPPRRTRHLRRLPIPAGAGCLVASTAPPTCPAPDADATAWGSGRTPLSRVAPAPDGSAGRVRRDEGSPWLPIRARNPQGRPDPRGGSGPAPRCRGVLRSCNGSSSDARGRPPGCSSARPGPNRFAPRGPARSGALRGAWCGTSCRPAGLTVSGASRVRSGASATAAVRAGGGRCRPDPSGPRPPACRATTAPAPARAVPFRPRASPAPTGVRPLVGRAGSGGPPDTLQQCPGRGRGRWAPAACQHRRRGRPTRCSNPDRVGGAHAAPRTLRSRRSPVRGPAGARRSGLFPGRTGSRPARSGSERARSCGRRVLPVRGLAGASPNALTHRIGRAARW